MVGIFAGVYGNIAKYREGMLMGVHIPKSEMEHPDVKELLLLYKKRNRQFYLWNMLAGIAVCLLCFTYFSIFITVWTLWFVEFCLLTILRVYHYHQTVYDIKQKNGWIRITAAGIRCSFAGSIFFAICEEVRVSTAADTSAFAELIHPFFCLMSYTFW